MSHESALKYDGFKSEVQHLIRWGQKMPKSTSSYRHLKPKDRMTIANLMLDGLWMSQHT